ncbi:MAG TPA: hypothetical protein VFB62_04980 [Polyangiaceae bacterium]|jgi:hypothetical protein|nr:hypothetical protein [Polyangiaceae bacterium]
MRPLCFGILFAASGCAQLLNLDDYDDRDPQVNVAAATGGGASVGGSSPGPGGAGGTAGAAGTAGAGGAGGSLAQCGGGLCVFVSQTPVRPGNAYDFDSLGEADALCTSWASGAGLRGVTWRAWLSDGNENALDHLGTTNGPWMDHAGNLVASNKLALANGSTSGIGLSQDGMVVIGLAWTGTLSNAVTGIHCNNWDSSDASAQGVVGKVGSNMGAWTEFDALGCDLSNHLYCFEIE